MQKVRIGDEDNRIWRLVAVPLSGSNDRIPHACAGAETLETVCRERSAMIRRQTSIPSSPGNLDVEQHGGQPMLRGRVVVVLTAAAPTAAL